MFKGLNSIEGSLNFFQGHLGNQQQRVKEGRLAFGNVKSLIIVDLSLVEHLIDASCKNINTADTHLF